MKLAVEELFTNMVKYNPENSADVLICLEHGGKGLRVKMTDFGVKPFDFTKLKEVDVNKRIEERTPGGLGIFLTRKLVDEIHYEYVNGNNVITFVKNVEH